MFRRGKEVRLALAVGILILSVAAGIVAYRRSAQPMNVLLITLDTTRADRIGCYGYHNAETPFLDELARQGVLFERAYAPAPMTSPSHTSMMTGLWPPEHGVNTNAVVTLDTQIPTIAEAFKQRGYVTAAFPAASMLKAKYGLNRGFDEYHDDLSRADSGADSLHRYRDGRINAGFVVDWLRKLPKTAPAPFFCWVHFYDAHDPYFAHPQEFGDKFRDQPYDGEIAYTDRQIGRMLDELKQLGQRSRTVIIVVGDHGESLGEHGEETHGYMLYESTLRVPLIIADPQRSSHGRRVATPVSLVDLFPTMLQLANAKVPADVKHRSLQPALTGLPLEPRVCYSQTDEPFLEASWSPLRGLTTQRWRYVRSAKPELYDLTADPRELTNLADKLPDQVQELDGELADFEAKLQRRIGKQVALSARERQALESLGYTGRVSTKGDPQKAVSQVDVKDMIGYLNQFHRASHLIDEKKYAEAATLLEPLARDVPSFLRARLNLAQCQTYLGNYADAISWCQAALEIDATSERAYEMMGFSHLKLRELDLAEQSFVKLLKLRPDSETGHLYLAEVYQRRGNFPLAMEHYQTVLQINPNNVLALQVLKALRDATGQP